MSANIAKSLILTGLLASASPGLASPALATETLRGEQVAKNISVMSFGKYKIHTFSGISNSHIIETPSELRLIDAQMKLSHAKALKKYIDGLKKPLVQVILSHNHPDHWFGAQVFATKTSIATSRNVMSDLNKGGARYIKILKKKLKDEVPDKVIVPSVELSLGKHNWDGLELIVEEHVEQESHHSLLIKIPAYGIMIGQDLFYNKMFLVASERKRNRNWQKLLAGFRDNEAKTYKTLLVGHGKNGGPSILDQDIKYLDALEALMEKGLSQQKTSEQLIKMFPEKGGKGMLNISMRNLFHGH